MESTEDEPYFAAIAAGGLGTRRSDWSRYLPKEYFPVEGRPGIVLLLEEVAELGNVQAAMVHHPYYSPFAAWASRVLNMPDAYDRMTGAARPTRTSTRISVDLIAQHGPYSDITSVLNADDHLGRPGALYVLYSDNLYPDANPVRLLRGSAAETAVIARPYTRDQAARRGVLVCDNGYVLRVVEKPDGPTAQELETRHGSGNLALLEGRVRAGRAFLDYLHAYRCPRGTADEPKLSLALSSYAQTAPVRIRRIDTPVTDLGAPLPSAC
ncbi:sugar phosphate nucleotidyltransferase [Streptomonospora salina]|uniref:NDP-sugar pyrophosphorylase family protein n=1 Tax=Streptomonospora salina TaxID=104205 RepID=A0A841E3Q4_9ACTN|nr:sugar phosphate nucleotidyltransferase [Streptomonospora salina]MBB5998477.1 NDP-sugar pyrophosphorylase family protein [Streptomonospora salina]